MESSTGLEPQTPMSRQKMAAASAFAALVATVIFVGAVLPAEYGIDPLGTGEALGLLAISGRGQIENLAPPPGSTEFTPVQKGPAALYQAEYRTDAAEFVLEPYEYVEYKYHLETGAGMVFAWHASSPVIHDFHGEPDSAADGGETSYDMRETAAENGSFAAPFTGIHGWYWENPGGDRITIRVTSSGFYNAAVEISYNGTRKRHEVAPPKGAPTGAE
jgi:hypothetical protein